MLAGCLERLAAACVAAGEPDRALDHIRRWLSLDPMHEPAHQAMIRALAWTGQRSAAVRQYRELVGILDRELAVRPLPETTRLYDDLRAGRLEPRRAGPAPVPGASGPARCRVKAAAARPAPPPRWPPRLPPRRPPPPGGRPRSTAGHWLAGRRNWACSARPGAR